MAGPSASAATKSPISASSIRLATRKFFLNLAPPSFDLIPAATASGEAAAYDSETRKRVLDAQFGKQFRRLGMAILRSPLASPAAFDAIMEAIPGT